MDADGLPACQRGARRHARAVGRHRRPGPHLQRRPRRLHRVVGAARARPADPRSRRAVAHRLPRRPGCRRRDAHGQLDRHPHRRVPAGPTRRRSRHQHGRCARRAVHRTDRRWPAVRGELALDLLGERAPRCLRDRVVLPEPPRDQQWQPGSHRLVGQPHLRRRADRRAGRHHLRHPALRRSRHGLDQPAGAHRAHRRQRGAGALPRHRVPRGAADVRPAAVPDPRVLGGQRRGLARRDLPRWPAVHADHLAAGHLAAAARLQLRRHPAVGRHLPAAADRRLPHLRAGCRLAVRPARRPRVRQRRTAADGRHLRRPAAAADRLRLLAVRRADLPQRRRLRASSRRPTPPAS